jgi:hypothetical protein
VNDDSQDGTFRLVANRPDFIWAYSHPINDNSGDELIQRWTRWMSIKQDFVFLLQLESGMCDPVGKFSIVCKQQQAGRWPVQPSNRDDTLGDINQIKHRPSSALILSCGDVSLWLVQHDVSFALVANQLAVNCDRLTIRIDAEAERSNNLSIDRHTAIGNHLFGFPAGRDAPGGQHFV